VGCGPASQPAPGDKWLVEKHRFNRMNQGHFERMNIFRNKWVY
jgi:hypothetical protein